MKLGPHDADDLVRLFVQLNLAADHVAVGSKPPQPRPVSENNFMVCVRLVFFRRKYAPKNRFSFQNIEPPRGNFGSFEAFRKSVRGVVEVVVRVYNRGCGENLLAVANLGEIRRGNDDALQAKFVVFDAQRHQAVRMTNSRWMQEQRIHYREYRRVGADAEGQRYDGDGGEARILPQHPQAEAHILQ